MRNLCSFASSAMVCGPRGFRKREVQTSDAAGLADGRLLSLLWSLSILSISSSSSTLYSTLFDTSTDLGATCHSLVVIASPRASPGEGTRSKGVKGKANEGKGGLIVGVKHTWRTSARTSHPSPSFVLSQHCLSVHLSSHLTPLHSTSSITRSSTDNTGCLATLILFDHRPTRRRTHQPVLSRLLIPPLHPFRPRC